MEKETDAINGVDVLQRIAGVSFIAGALIVIAANAAHPRVGDPSDYHAVLQMIADTRGGYWEAVHLFLAMGMWALAAGFAGLYRSFGSGAGSAWARLGFYGILMGTTLFTLDFGLEGLGRAVAVHAMQTAAAADQAAIQGFLIGLTVVSHPIFGLAVIVYWGSLALVGIAILRGEIYSKWSGWALLVFGSANAFGTGLPYALRGASMTVDMIFAVLATLSALIALVLGVGMLRVQTRKSRMTAPRASA
jgi:hypothetical protein